MPIVITHQEKEDILVCLINTVTMPVGQKRVRHIDAEFTLKSVFGKSSFRYVIGHPYSVLMLTEDVDHSKER